MQHGQDEETKGNSIKKLCLWNNNGRPMEAITCMTFIKIIDCIHVHIASTSRFDVSIVYTCSSKYMTKVKPIDSLMNRQTICCYLENIHNIILKIATSKTMHPDTRYVFYNSCEFYYLRYNCCLCYVPI